MKILIILIGTLLAIFFILFIIPSHNTRYFGYKGHILVCHTDYGWGVGELSLSRRECFDK